MNMKRSIAMILTLLLAVMMFGCTAAPTENTMNSTEDPKSAPETVTLDFYAHTDFLGNLQTSDSAPGAAMLASVMDELVEGNPAGSFFFNLGDALSGTPIAALVEGKSVVEAINAMSYDSFTLGNHELDWGPNILVHNVGELDIPVLCANVIDKGTGEPLEGTVPYVILEKKDVKVGVLGLITDSTPTIIRSEYADKLEFLDTVESAAKYVPEMREAGAEIVVIAGHLPMYQEDGSNEYNGELLDILNQVDGIDVAFGGHNETLLIAEEINGVPTVKTAFYGSELSHVSLVYDRTSKTITDSVCESINVTDLAKTLTGNSDIEVIVAKYAKEADEIFDETIGTASEDCEVDYFYECSVTNWFADALREATGTDMAFINPSGVFESVSAGDITLRKIYQMSPFENELVIAEMTGAELKELWETTLEEDRMLKYGTLAFSGLFITYDSTNGNGQKVISMTQNDGTPIEDDDVFTVTTLDFLSTGGNDYTMLSGLEWTGTALMMRDAYADALAKREMLTNEVTGWMTDLSH